MFHHWLCELRASLIDYHTACDARSGIALVSLKVQADVWTPGDARFSVPLSSIFRLPAPFLFVFLCFPFGTFYAAFCHSITEGSRFAWVCGCCQSRYLSAYLVVCCPPNAL
ncbi:hypothetical protein LX32DRAFT_272886 [Colletotrichum zoysiae]|uniref:Uncharacterized protein n=1 Tax=Colletotrichum zoysiae TaxID=1216348 RepID=A0AAD9HLM4_9PEZI|nr:hypothetical protein LX32DRAFT_272886 [Colletotrichum zoysiae]